MTAPFGPTSTFSTFAVRQRALIGDDLEEMAHFVGQRSEAVDQFGGEGLDRLRILQVGEAAVEAEAELEVGDVALRDHHRHADGDLRRPLALLRRLRAALQGRHRLLEHLLVELVADFPDMAGLLLAEQIAGAADVEVVAGELEAGAERIERLKHLQAPISRSGSAPSPPAP